MTNHPIFKQWAMSMGDEHKPSSHKLVCQNCGADYTPGTPGAALHKRNNPGHEFKRVKRD